MKKLLLLITLSITTMAGPQERMAKNIMREMKKVSSSHCKEMPAMEAACHKDFNMKMEKRMKALNSTIINESLKLVRREESNKIKYQDLLKIETLSYTNSMSSGELKEMYDNHMKEKKCVINKRAFLSEHSISFQPTDSCAALKILKDEYIASLEPIPTATVN